jgi:hypothetical protein
MALQVDLQDTDIGIPVPETYARIANLKINGDGFSIHVEYFATEEARQQRLMRVYAQAFYGQLDEFPAGDNPVASAYLWLKEQDEFQSALDI